MELAGLHLPMREAALRNGHSAGKIDLTALNSD
jgi:hypothetical protein